jgi:hypothetical protein
MALPIDAPYAPMEALSVDKFLWEIVALLRWRPDKDPKASTMDQVQRSGRASALRILSPAVRARMRQSRRKNRGSYE